MTRLRFTAMWLIGVAAAALLGTVVSYLLAGPRAWVSDLIWSLGASLAASGYIVWKYDPEMKRKR